MIQDIKLPSTTTIYAQTGAGKTHFIKNTLMPLLKGQYDVLVIMCPTMNLTNDYDWIEEDEPPSNCKDRVQTIFKISENISDSLQEIIETQTKLIDESKSEVIEEDQVPRILIILDDCLGSKILKQNGMLNKFSAKSRHYKISFIITSQTMNGIPTTLRINSKYVICMSVASYTELEKVALRYVPKKHQREFQKTIEELFDEKYNYIFIDNSEQRISLRLWKNGTELMKWKVE